MTGTDSLQPIADRIRDILGGVGADTPLPSYRQIAGRLGLHPPGVIGTVAQALELTMHEDAAAGRPMVAALVISRAGDMPRRGFFDLAVKLGRFAPDPAGHRQAWLDECAAVLARNPA